MFFSPFSTVSTDFYKNKRKWLSSIDHILHTPSWMTDVANFYIVCFLLLSKCASFALCLSSNPLGMTTLCLSALTKTMFLSRIFFAQNNQILLPTAMSVSHSSPLTSFLPQGRHQVVLVQPTYSKNKYACIFFYLEGLNHPCHFLPLYHESLSIR